MSFVDKEKCRNDQFKNVAIFFNKNDPEFV